MALPDLVDRSTELEALLDHADAAMAGDPRLVVVLGRRQVGKTFLLHHLVDRLRRRGMGAVFATGLRSASERQQLDHLVEATRSGGVDGAVFVPDRFESWASVLRWATTAARQQPLLLVLDEVPWFVESTPVLPSEIQQVWDDLRIETSPPSLLIVLCGSAVASMKALVDGSGPLYGRTAAEQEIQPFDLRAAAQVLPDLEPAALIEAYAACGGYPLHLRAWDQSATTEDNLRRLAVQPGGLLLRGGERLIVDLPEAGGYRRALHAIGSGDRRRVDVARSAAQRVDQPLDLLLRSSLVRHRRPLGAPDRFPGIYEIDDVYLRFWYEICWADQGLIEGGAGDVVLERRHGRWRRHLGWVFEELARQHALRLSARGELPHGLYGEWWSDRGGQVQIDVLGLDGKRTVMAGEVRWDRRPLGLRDVGELVAKVNRSPEPVPEPVLAFWSRGGVRDDVASEGILSFTPADVVDG
jgi:AAA+ ATPase superfamily predicted ATPase